MSDEKFFKVSDPYYGQIKDGSKSIEARMKFGPYLKIEKGDTVTVYDSNKENSFKVKIDDIHSYETFAALFEAEGVEKVFPDIKEKEKALEIVRGFYKGRDGEDNFEKFQANGVLAFHLKLEKKASGGKVRRTRSKSRPRKKSRSRSRGKGKK